MTDTALDELGPVDYLGRHGAGEHRGGAHLGEPVGGAVRISGAPCVEADEASAIVGD